MLAKSTDLKLLRRIHDRLDLKLLRRINNRLGLSRRCLATDTSVGPLYPWERAGVRERILRDQRFIGATNLLFATL